MQNPQCSKKLPSVLLSLKNRDEGFTCHQLLLLQLSAHSFHFNHFLPWGLCMPWHGLQRLMTWHAFSIDALQLDGSDDGQVQYENYNMNSDTSLNTQLKPRNGTSWVLFHQQAAITMLARYALHCHRMRCCHQTRGWD